MSRVKEFPLPDLGEGLTEGEILKWLVGVGDTVTLNQPIVEVETAKAAVEIPAKWAGKVTEIFHPEGSTVEVGTPIIAIDTDPSAPSPSAEALAAVQLAPAEGAVEPGLIGGPAPGGRTAVLVGYGPRTAAAKRRPRKESPPAVVPPAAVEPAVPEPAAVTPVLAKPPVRK
ncbi:MAG TPA: biotin/lipoyl-containing protein, partial [Micromonosporaceae bacterium]|nr:biotin/lipoyl-containing protein [Micromonosporaceae bacterium]